MDSQAIGGSQQYWFQQYTLAGSCTLSLHTFTIFSKFPWIPFYKLINKQFESSQQ